jgi:hypothetical protein
MDAVAQLFGLGGLIAFATKLLDLVRYARAQEWNGVLTQLGAWVSGTVAVFIFGQSDVARQIDFGETVGSLGHLDSVSKIILGVGLASLGSLVVDLRKATDASDSAVVPPLINTPSTRVKD